VFPVLFLRDLNINTDLSAQPTGSMLYICIFCCMIVFSCLSLSALSLLQDLQAATINPDPSLKEFEGATLRYASLKLRCVKGINKYK